MRIADGQINATPAITRIIQLAQSSAGQRRKKWIQGGEIADGLTGMLRRFAAWLTTLPERDFAHHCALTRISASPIHPRSALSRRSSMAVSPESAKSWICSPQKRRAPITRYNQSDPLPKRPIARPSTPKRWTRSAGTRTVMLSPTSPIESLATEAIMRWGPTSKWM